MSALIQLPPKPSPLPIPAGMLAPDGYLQLCDRLGIAEPTFSYEQRVLDFMRRSGMTRYSNDDVDQYMDRISSDAKRDWAWAPLGKGDARLDGGWRWIRSARPSGLKYALLAIMLAFVAAGLVTGAHCGPGYKLGPVFILAPLGAFCCAMIRWMVEGELRRCGGFSAEIYKHPIPAEHLRNAVRLRDEFPELKFFASTYEVATPDPFIMCTIDGSWRIVFGVWDEPGFGT